MLPFRETSSSLHDFSTKITKSRFCTTGYQAFSPTIGDRKRYLSNRQQRFSMDMMPAVVRPPARRVSLPTCTGATQTGGINLHQQNRTYFVPVAMGGAGVAAASIGYSLYRVYAKGFAKGFTAGRAVARIEHEVERAKLARNNVALKFMRWRLVRIVAKLRKRADRAEKAKKEYQDMHATALAGYMNLQRNVDCYLNGGTQY